MWCTLRSSGLGHYFGNYWISWAFDLVVKLSCWAVDNDTTHYLLFKGPWVILSRPTWFLWSLWIYKVLKWNDNAWWVLNKVHCLVSNGQACQMNWISLSCLMPHDWIWFLPYTCMTSCILLCKVGLISACPNCGQEHHELFA